MERAAKVGRRSPYEIVFSGVALGEGRLAAIRDEAREAGVDTARRDQFAGLPAVRELLGDLVPDFAEPASLDRYLEILHHCFLFWHGGCRYYALEEPTLRSLVRDPPDLAGWMPRFDPSALYIELPQNLCWAAVLEGEPPEPVEGMYAILRADRATPETDILLVLGVRPERPGFSVAELTADLGSAAESGLPEAFTSDIPGAELADLYSLQRSGEVVTALLRTLWYLETYPEACELMPATTDDGDPDEGPSATLLEHVRVRSVERERG